MLGDLVVPEKILYLIIYYNKFRIPYIPQQIIIVDGQLNAQKTPKEYPAL